MPITTTLNDDAAFVSGILWRFVGKTKVLEGYMSNLCIRQYRVVSHDVDVAWLVVDPEKGTGAPRWTKLVNLAMTDVGATLAGPPGERDHHLKASETISPRGIDRV